MDLAVVGRADVDDVRDFLRACDLTPAGLDEPGVRLWAVREAGQVVGTTGFETSGGGAQVLLRSVAVAPAGRAAGAGTRFARHVLDQAVGLGARRAWLFSRRSGPFWQRLGFGGADRDALVAAIPDAHQVRLSARTGRLEREVAWGLDLR